MEVRRLTVDGHEVAAFAANESAAGTPLVFLHGILTSIDIWPIILPPEIQQHRRWYAISLPGHYPGRFPPNFGRRDITAEMFAKVIGGAIQQLVGEQPVIIVGWSTGGFAALNLAAQNPQHVAAVMSVAGFARGVWGGLFGFLQRLTRLPLLKNRLAPMISRAVNATDSRAEWFMLRGAGQPIAARQSPDWKPVMASLRDAGRNLDPLAMADLFARLREIDISDSLSTITAPVMIVAGLRDPYVTSSETRHLLSCLRGAESTWLPDAGHLIFFEARDAWRNLLLTWLNRVDPT